MRISDWSSDVCSSDLVITVDCTLSDRPKDLHNATSLASCAKSQCSLHLDNKCRVARKNGELHHACHLKNTAIGAALGGVRPTRRDMCATREPLKRLRPGPKAQTSGGCGKKMEVRVKTG